ncbi:MAG: hypothetical protein KGI89_17500, partial [Euryarchaeota archaeon]|nr:hypothetical protein [Euryarchaeota archaeon]
FGPIAVAVLTELDAIGLFLNHYRVPGSDFDLARIGAMAHHARGLIRAGGLQPENVRDLVEKMGESFKEAMRKYIESP